MLDLSYIPNSQQDIKIFYTNGITNAWQTWQKPRKCNYVWMMCIGGGGGGAGGKPTSVVVPYATGGASGGVSRALYNTNQIPDTLYVQVGVGGAGGISNTAGSSGTRSFISLTPAIGSALSVLGSGTAGAAGGTVSTGLNANGEPAVGQANVNFLALSNFISIAGVAAIGNAGLGVPPNLTPLTSHILTAGGGSPTINTSTSSAYDGASILASSINPLIAGGAFATGAGIKAGNGADGYTSWKPFFSTGGAGGGSSLNGDGGDGGDGGIGSGGGAGGGCPLANIGGTGGRGGDGIVIIISF